MLCSLMQIDAHKIIIYVCVFPENISYIIGNHGIILVVRIIVLQNSIDTALFSNRWATLKINQAYRKVFIKFSFRLSFIIDLSEGY